jgi:hypothetical protein
MQSAAALPDPMRDGERVWILWASFLLGLSGHRTQAKPAFPVGSEPVACDARFRQSSQLGVRLRPSWRPDQGPLWSLTPSPADMLACPHERHRAGRLALTPGTSCRWLRIGSLTADANTGRWRDLQARPVLRQRRHAHAQRCLYQQGVS